jgi:hypothetical protein
MFLTECDHETSTMRTRRPNGVDEPWGRERENKDSYCYSVSYQRIGTNNIATIMWVSTNIFDTKGGFSNHKFWEPLNKKFLPSSQINFDRWPYFGL